MRCMTGEGGGAAVVLQGLRKRRRPHPSGSAVHLLPQGEGLRTGGRTNRPVIVRSVSSMAIHLTVAVRWMASLRSQ